MFPITAFLLLTSAAGAPHHAVAVAPIRQDTLTVKEAEPGLKAKAKVPSDSAMKVALAKVGRISEAELEREHGPPLLSQDLPGITRRKGGKTPAILKPITQLCMTAPE